MQPKQIFTDKFAPDRMLLTPEEETRRLQFCLNGSWRFAPMPLPADWRRGEGIPPALPLPAEEDFSDTPIRIPSAWNGNIWGNGRVDRHDPEKRYAPDSLYYPSYPAEWDQAKQGWLRRTVTLPAGQEGRRLILHFESVMGNATVLVNGQPVGSHFDSFMPFELDVTDYLHEGENDLLVGVQQMHLFDKQSTTYKKMKTPYPHGSNTQDLAGIWQDVYLFSLPPVYIDDVYVKPLVAEGRLEYDVTVVNATAAPQMVTLTGGVHTFICTPDSPVPDGHLGDCVLPLPANKLMLSPSGRITVTCAATVGDELSTWTPDTPHLHALVLDLQADGGAEDKRVTRFGWRQWKLRGKELLLNEQPIVLVADICHPFGPFMFSRRFIQSWYRLIKSVGGNAVRLHAQPHPQVFLDVADEMGICVLDETAIFGSCLTLNFEEDIAWQRYQEQFDGLILRDRNRPSVFGWSFGNELFAIFLYDEVAKRDEKGFYAKLYALGNRARALDTTREFVTCDGDEDLLGTLPVWSKHYGHNARTLPDIDKPMVVGENGGTYYARPEQMAIFNGETAFESYAGRNQALGIDLYNNLRAFENKLVYFSPSEFMWFGLEPLPYGYNDFSRLPTFEDGIFFPHFAEGEPGMYIERIPPYVGNLNPGWDATLPEYRELDMVRAMRDALKQDDTLNAKWQPTSPTLPQPPVYAQRTTLSFAGSSSSDAYALLGNAGLTFVGDGQNVVVDTDSCRDTARERINTVTEAGGMAFLQITTQAGADKVADWLGSSLTLTRREATMLRRNAPHPFVASIGLPEMYFAENDTDKYILSHGLAGGLVEQGEVLLAAANVDWSLFNNRPENRKCGAVKLYEDLQKESGAALVLLPHQKGYVLLSSLRMTPHSAAHSEFFHRLFTNMGVAVGDCRPIEEHRQAAEHDLLLNGPVSD